MQIFYTILGIAMVTLAIMCGFGSGGNYAKNPDRTAPANWFLGLAFIVGLSGSAVLIFLV